MGTYYSVKVPAANSKIKTELKEKIDQRLVEINQIFSTYIKDSEISKINSTKKSISFDISKELFEVLTLSNEIYQSTEGYFDVTVGPIVNAWGFGPDGKQKRPDVLVIKKLKESIGMNLISLPAKNKLLKQHNDLYIDLSAIAKGYGVDKVLELVKEQGYSNALVEIGGEVRTLGTKPDGSLWLIGIEKPSEELGTGIQDIVGLSGMAMATSGSYRNFVKYGDEVFSHTIDPITAKPALNNVISVTVLASSCARADAYATAFMAMGAERGLNLAKKLGLPAYFIVKNGSSTAIMHTDSFKRFLKGK